VSIIPIPAICDELLIFLVLFQDIAPEVMAEWGSGRYGLPVDIWSSGIVLYICLCGFPPFSDELKTEEFPYTLLEQIQGARFDYPSPYWDPVGDPALDLIDSMIVVDVEKRFTVKECLNHPWMLDRSPHVLPDMVRSASPEPLGDS
jgi:serine/threonine-protein kinase Chk2